MHGPMSEPMDSVRDIFDSEADARNVENIYPLSPLQQGMLFHRLLDEHNDTYLQSILWELQDRRHVPLLTDAIQSVMSRHEALRSAVLWEDRSHAVQVVYRTASLPIEQLVLDARRGTLEQLHEQMRSTSDPIDLTRAPLLRLKLTHDPHSSRWYAILQVHHLACDHHSLRALISEVIAYAEGRDQSLPQALPLSELIDATATDSGSDTAEAFFRRKLADVEEPTAPFGLMEVRGGPSQLDEASETLADDLSMRVRQQAHRLGVSAARMFHAAWALVVAHTSGRDDIVFGTVVSTARAQGVRSHRALGVSVNTLPLRMDLTGLTAESLIERTQSEIADLLIHAQSPLSLARRCSGIGGSALLFTSILNYRHSVPEAEAQRVEAHAIRAIARADASTHYPIALTVENLGERFVVYAQTDARVPAARITGCLRAALESLTDALERAPQTPALALSILPSDERRRVLEEFNATDVALPAESCVHRWFERQVERAPGVIAVVCADRQLTYAELNHQADSLASELVARGVRPDDRVGVYIERSIEMVVSWLAVLKAGGAYVPLDVSYPSERIAYMLTDSAPVVVLTQERLEARLSDVKSQVVIVDRIDEGAFQNPTIVDVDVRPEHLAYVIYTSGSTGTPKGVMIEHRSLANLLQWTHRAYDMQPGWRCSSVAATGFDAATWEVWSALTSGATLVLAPVDRSADPERLLDWWSHEALDISFLPTPMAEFAFANGIRSPQLRVLQIGGDRLRNKPANIPFALVNNYGPTEAAVVTISGEICDSDAVIHIGKPVDNTQIYIVDAHGHPVPVGVPGEVLVGGENLARGYLNRPLLTAERFISNPFSPESSARVYRTGDLAQWREDGTIEYLGRNDDQVKIRGFRIELGEIEARLASHARVKEAFVTARDDARGEKRLVAYVVPADAVDAPIDIEQLRSHLRETLPEYMVPGAVVTLDRFPLTANGKVDRRALPMPALDAFATRPYVAPEGETEQTLAAIWQELLGVQRVGRLDNFFELGGHSLLILQLIERLSRVGIAAQARDVFHSATLAALAQKVAGRAQTDVVEHSNVPVGCTRITPPMLTLIDLDQEHIDRIVGAVPDGAVNVQDIYPLAPLQEGILFHHLLDSQQADAYVVPTLFYLESRELAQALISAVQAAVNRHDVLRTAVLWEQLPQPVQVVLRRVQLPVDVVSFDAEREASDQACEWLLPENQKMDLRKAPLIRVRVADEPRGPGCYVLLQLHHIVADVNSLRQIIVEVREHVQGRAAQLPPSRPYREHIARILDYRRTSDAESFFSDKLGSVEETTAPFALLDVHSDGSDTLETRDAWDEALARRLRRQARRLGVSVASVLHAAWAMAVACTSGRSDVVFGTVLLGRGQASADTRQSLGMFINSLPLRIQLQQASAEQLVQQAHRELAQLLEHELADLAVAQRSSGVDSSQPLFTALLNYVHGSVELESQFDALEGMRFLGTRSATNYPIVLSIGDDGETFRLEMKTDRRVDPARMLDYMTTATTSLVDALESSPETHAVKLRVVPEREWRDVIEGFNTPHTVTSSDVLIHELFERQVERFPHAIAATFEGLTLTYRELNEAANRLAHHLIAQGVRSDQLVGLCLERNLDLIVAVLGILKAGGAYLPLDPTYPQDRLQHMLTDSAPAVVVTHEHLRAVLPESSARIVTLDGHREQISRRSASNIRTTGECGKQLAYVIYTSGSTGKPKGVMVEHRNVTRLFSSTDAWFGFHERCVWTLFHSIAFDFSVWELWGALLYGGRVVVVPHATARSPQEFYRLLCHERVTVLNQTPSAFAQLIDAQARSPELKHSLRYVVFGGEALEFHTLRPWTERNGDASPQLINMYGITETTVHVTYRRLTAAEIDSERGSLIGRAIPDLSIYLLDAAGQPVPVGVTGEIYVGGAGVARGYLNRPELTAQRFLDDPFSTEPHARMYRSGDLGKWRADGTLEYLGRNDHQVKIRGFRIELGEIEARLTQHPCVRDAVVIPREDAGTDKRLVAYIVPDDTTITSLDADELRRHVREMQPEYMVPSAFVTMAQLPLTPNGKLDKKALPAPQLDAFSARQYEAPQGEIEELLAGIWRELLRVERVGRRDSFFELGGHSLSAMQLMARISARLSVDLPVRWLFDHPTLKDLAADVQKARGASVTTQSEDDAELDELLEEVMASLPESEVRAWLNELRTEERR